MDLEVLATLFIFSSALALAGGLLAGRKAKKQLVKGRLQKYTGKPDQAIPQGEKAGEEEKERIRKVFKAFSRVVAPKRWIVKVERELSQADIPLRPEEFVTLQMVVTLVLPLKVYYLNESLLLATFVALLAAVLPPVMVKRAKAKRVAIFNSQLGDGLGILANSLRAGFSFLQAVDTLSKEMPPPLSTEFTRLLKEMNLGTTTEEALDNLLKRVDSEDLELVVTAVKIQRQVGGNLAEVLERIEDTIRQRIKLKRELKTLTAQGRISGIIIGLLPFFLAAALAIFNPSYLLTLVKHPLGLFLLAWAFFSQVVGYLVIKKIVNIEY